VRSTGSTRPDTGLIGIAVVAFAVGVLACSGGPVSPSPGAAATPSPESSLPSPGPTDPSSTESPTHTTPASDSQGALVSTAGGYLLFDQSGQKRLELPDGEVGLTAENGVVVSRIEGSTETTVIVRDFDGNEIARRVGPELISSAAVKSGQLYLTGIGGADGSEDVGVIAFDLGDKSERAVVPPGEMPARDPGGSPGYGARGPLLVSPSGNLLAVMRCDNLERCSVDLVDLAGGAVLEPLSDLQGSFLAFLGEQTIVIASATEFRGIDVDSRKTLWTIPVSQLQGGRVERSGTRLLVAYRVPQETEPMALRLSRVDLQSGFQSVVREWADPGGRTLWPEFTTEEVAVIGDESDPASAFAKGGSALLADVVTLDTGEVAEDGFALRLD
jgi:hypothetical protein